MPTSAHRIILCFSQNSPAPVSSHHSHPSLVIPSYPCIQSFIVPLSVASRDPPWSRRLAIIPAHLSASELCSRFARVSSLSPFTVYRADPLPLAPVLSFSFLYSCASWFHHQVGRYISSLLSIVSCHQANPLSTSRVCICIYSLY